MANPLITNMNINSQRYDLAGNSSSVIYHDGYGIHINPDGSIDFTGDLNAATPEELEALRQYFETEKDIIVGKFDPINNKLTSFASWQALVDDDVATLKAQAWSSEGLWSELRLIPGKITSTVTGIVDSEGYKNKIVSSVMDQSTTAFSLEFKKLDDATKEMQRYGEKFTMEPTGLKISADPTSGEQNYTQITSNGLEIWSDGAKVAEATSKRFYCMNGFGVDHWIIEEANGNPNSLLFYKGA